MTIRELLIRIKKDVSVPKVIKYDDEIWTFDNNIKDYKNELWEFTRYVYQYGNLDEKVEKVIWEEKPVTLDKPKDFDKQKIFFANWIPAEDDIEDNKLNKIEKVDEPYESCIFNTDYDNATELEKKIIDNIELIRKKQDELIDKVNELCISNNIEKLNGIKKYGIF